VPAWQAGTAFTLGPSNSEKGDRSDPFSRELAGNCTFTTGAGARAGAGASSSVNVVGNVCLQSAQLFHFDARMKAPSLQVRMCITYVYSLVHSCTH
jgi:hypothetical protein